MAAASPIPNGPFSVSTHRGGRAFIVALNEVILADLLGNRRMKQQFKQIDIASIDSSPR